MRCVYACSLILLSPLMAFAEPPKVPSKPVVLVPNGKPATVIVTVPNDYGMAPSFTGDECLWFPGETDKDGNKSFLVQAYKAGNYQVTFWTKGETAYSVVRIDATGGEPVPPQPAPVPPQPVPPQPVPPQPVPPVTPTDFYSIVVEETAKRSPQVAKILNDLEFWKSLPALGYRFYDKDSADTKAKNYDKLALQEIDAYALQGVKWAAPTPILMLVDKSGNLIRSCPLPATTKEIRDFIKMHTGK